MGELRQMFTLDLPVASGWKALRAEVRTAPFHPIILLTFVHDTAPDQHVRLDLGKRMFLDAPPEGVPYESSKQIADELTGRVRSAVLG